MALEVIGSAKSKSTPKTFGEFCTNLPGVNEPVNWMTGDDYCEHALEHYNETQGVNFELVKVVGFAPIFVAYYTCFHFNFLAKPKDGDDQSPRLFFAEVCDSFMGKYIQQMDVPYVMNYFIQKTPCTTVYLPTFLILSDIEIGGAENVYCCVVEGGPCNVLKVPKLVFQ
ncbi:Methionine synthase [Bienertia sinuspersici]